MKTIAQLANEIGVSKQAVFYRMKKAPLSNILQPLTSKIDGVLMVTFDGENLIKQAFNAATAKVFDDKEPPKGVKKPSKEGALLDGEIVKILQGNISILQQQLETKDGQLAAKDKQIEELTATIRIQAESINADRKNELAGTLIDGQKKLTEGKNPKDQNEKRPKKSSFFGLFQKKS